MGIASKQTLESVGIALGRLEQRRALLRYRREKGIELRGIPREFLEERLADAFGREPTIVLDEQWNQIIHDLWSNITSAYRTGGIMGHRLDHFENRVETLVHIGVRSLCFVQEGYRSPAVGVDFYFNPQEQEGVEAVIDNAGTILFTDPEVDQFLPQSVRTLFQAVALAHYQDIVCPQLFKDDDEDRGGIITTARTSRRQKREVTRRRAHFRSLHEGYKASPYQIALAYAEGRFSAEEIERYIKGDHKTYVGEWVRSDGMEENNPRRLIGVAVKFLDGYTRLVSV